MTLDPAVSWILGLGFALLFGVAAGHKFADRVRFLAVLRNYELIPAGLVPLTAMVIVAAEAAAALLLVPPAVRGYGALAAVALLAAYAIAIAINLLRGRTRIDCGCLGFGRQDRITWTMVARNLVLVALALALLLPASPRGLVALDALTISAGLVAMTLLAAALTRLGTLPAGRKGAP
ncbi:MAG: methylamine utilization protein MauE [Gammaproteobacteria bacterium]|nr:methylamine utilization protein MauE [Gammaproteobacteria bacterium]